MDDLDSLNGIGSSSSSGNLRARLLALAKSSASEEKFIEYISSRLSISSTLDAKALEIVLDLTLAVVDQYGYVNFNYFEARSSAANNSSVIRTRKSNKMTTMMRDEHAGLGAEELAGGAHGADLEERPERVPELSSYDGDDEDLDDTFIFPCHIMYDDCHPELLSDYHREHLKPSRESAHIIKLPKLCEFVIEFMLESFRKYITGARRTATDERDGEPDATSQREDASSDDENEEQEEEEVEKDTPKDEQRPSGKDLSVSSYLSFIVKLIKKVNKVCVNERRNCRILSRTGILSTLLQNVDFLLRVAPDEQHIYLEPLLKFAFTLADYRISGANLRQLLGVIKNEETNLKVVLRNLDRLLSHHYRILRNIKPSKSMNFPVASKTPEEIEYDLYVANSWHWRLRAKVIEFKRRRSRSSGGGDGPSASSAILLQDLKTTSTPKATAMKQETQSSNRSKPPNEESPKPPSSPSAGSRITPSWLECSLITPLSNISPLIHNGEVKFCCSMWMSVCGDLLVIEGAKAAQRKRAREHNGDNFDIDWNTLEGHWLRLTSRRRLVRRYKNNKNLVALSARAPRKRRLSAKIRRRQAYDKEDEELEEIEEKVRKSDAELTQGHSRNGRRFKLFHSSLSRQPRTTQSPISKQRDTLLKRARILDPKHAAGHAAHAGQDQAGGPPREYLGRRARDNAQELLVHLVSFAMDSLTIEIWLNVKCMTFCARACRVTREGQTNLLDQVTFSSHLEANGSWSNLMFCFEEQHASGGAEKIMNFKVIVNGVHKEKEKLTYSAPKSPVTNFAILIGCERSTFGYVWKLSQINIYKSIPDKSMPIYLLGKGPDFWSFTNFRQQSLLPLPDITQRHMRHVLQPKVLMRYSTVDEDQALNWLTQNIVISYVAHQPGHFLDYSLSVTSASIINPLPADYEFSNSAERFIQAKTLDFSRALKFNQNNGFGCALVEAGGIESVLMSFAEVVRRSPDDAQAHSLAFSVLLKMSQTNLYHLNKFLDELNGLKLVEYILTHPKCLVSRPMLESYLEFCLMSNQQHPQHTTQLQQLRESRSLVKSPKLIYHLMTAWRAWHKNARVARLLYKRLIKLIQPVEMPAQRNTSANAQASRTYVASSRAAAAAAAAEQHKLDCYYVSHNFSMITQAGGIDILMDVLRECLVPATVDSSPFINHDLIELIINLISLLIKHPPRLDVMLDIMEFLLFLHPDPKAYVEVTHDRLFYLRALQSTDRVTFDDDDEEDYGRNDARTPYSETPSESSEASSVSYGAQRPQQARLRANVAKRRSATGSLSSLAARQELDDYFSEEGEEDLESQDGGERGSYIERISNQCSRDLAEIIEKCNAQQQQQQQQHSAQADQQTAKMAGWTYGELASEKQQLYEEVLGGGGGDPADSARCSNRNFAIANIADMLASMVKLTSSDPLKILSGALQKHIIDPRKLIILANNESAFVREKVLRLFLYSIRACYVLNLKSILAEYEQKSKSDKYNVCVPIHLMARQLLKYSTTVRMIQLCYGIIVGVDDFETVDSVCLIFDIEVQNNHLQLNTLVLLMQLIPQLRQPRDIVPALQFVHAYLRQLLQLREDTTVGILIQSNLTDCIMNLYFSYVETTICLRQHAARGANSTTLGGDAAAPITSAKTADDVLLELDRLLVLIVRFHLQNQADSEELFESLDELLLHFDLLNSQVPVDFRYLLRDRKVKILLTALRFCRHYVEAARRKPYNGWFSSLYLKRGSSDSNRFGNLLSDADLCQLVDMERSGHAHQMSAFIESRAEDDDEAPGNNGGAGHRGNGKSPRSARRDADDVELDLAPVVPELAYETRDSLDSSARLGTTLDMASVVERLERTARLILGFVTARDPSIIMNFERQFILSCLQLLANYLAEFNASIASTTTRGSKNTGPTIWDQMLPKLVKSTFRACFARLLLYLVSPCEAMSLDDRGYFAQQILDMFSVYDLLHMLEEKPSSGRTGLTRSRPPSKSNHKVLLVFLKDLIEYSQGGDGGRGLAVANGDRGGGHLGELDELGQLSDDLDAEDLEERELDETAVRLRQLIRGLQAELETDELDSRSASAKKSAAAVASAQQQDSSRLDQKYRSIWLAELAQDREDLRDRLAALRLKFQHSNAAGGAASGKLTGGGLLAASLENLTGGGGGGGGGGSLSQQGDDMEQKFTDHAIAITKDVVNDKHEQRKAYLEEVKQSKIYNYHIRQQWLSIIIGHSHERAIWHMSEFYPKSWELNPVEGPSRTRRRLRPCRLKLESRFLRHPTRPTSAIGEARSPLVHSTTGGNFEESSAASSSSSAAASDQSSVADLVVDDWYSQYSPHPLCSLIINNEQSMDSNELRIRMFTTDKIHFNCDCSIIRPNEVCDGEVSIASWCIHFIGERADGDSAGAATPLARYTLQLPLARSRPPTSLGRNSAIGTPTSRRGATVIPPAAFGGTKSSMSLGTTGARGQPPPPAPVTSTVVEDLWFDEIVEIWDRRYQLQDVGLEIFLTNNMTYLLSFRNNRDREDFKQHLMREQHKMINLQRFNLTTSLNRLTQMWRDGKLTNFDYLTCLNKLAGRSFNDLMQYPIFPFVLANYDLEQLDLNEPSHFRNLRRPMAIQNEDREENFRNNYQMSQSSSLNIGALGLTKPYHYGNHYSNSATVLHFLVRLPPFTQMLIQYQDNNFDQPDRTFHAIANTWQLITRDSNTDFKELIPEFFFLPEMFLNIGELELGRKQNNQLVNDVRLPPWCPNSDARLFTLIHRQALESPQVSETLHHWIDLIFGYKQTGKAAIEALNVFHPATYYGGIDLSGQRQQHSLSSSTASGTSPATTNSLSIINLTIANTQRFSARSSQNPGGSDYQMQLTSNSDLPPPPYPSPPGGATPATTTTAEVSETPSTGQSPRRLVLTRFQQAEIERSALETMIKTYGQMPRQLFSTPAKQRSPATFAQQIIESQLERAQLEGGTAAPPPPPDILTAKRLEPMRQVRGLKWGTYVGSPADTDIIAVKHKRIILEQVRDYRRVSNNKSGANSSGANKQQRKPAARSSNNDPRNPTSQNNNQNQEAQQQQQQLSKQSDKFHFCLLANGDVAILRNNTSLMLDYRADRKSSGIYQLSVPSARYSRRAGLSRVSRMNLFSNMIISRQQFSFLEPIHAPSYASSDSPTSGGSGSSSASSLVATLTGSRVKFSLDSLNLVSWLYLDGTIRAKHPAISSAKPSIPLVQANTIVDTMTTCASVPELNLLLVGYNSGSICAHIVSTTYETSPLPRYIPTISTGAFSSSSPSSMSPSSSGSSPSAAAAAALSSSSAAPSAVHFLHTTTTHGQAPDASLLGPGRVTADKTLTGEPYTAVSLAGKTLQSVRSMNRTTRWLYCHSQRVNAIKINVSFGIVVTASADGTAVIWDLNSLTFVRTIDYKLKSLRLREDDNDEGTAHEGEEQYKGGDSLVWAYGRAKRHKTDIYLCNCPAGGASSVSGADGDDDERRESNQEPAHLNSSLSSGTSQRLCGGNQAAPGCYICTSGVDLIAISDTLGDIVTVKHLRNREAAASGEQQDDAEQLSHSRSVSALSDVGSAASSLGASSGTGSTGAASAHSSSSSSCTSLTSVIYVHTINGSLVNFVDCHNQVTAVNYSNAPEGISINVIVVGMVDGLIRLYSSWDLSRVKEFRVSGLGSPINDVMYTRDSQLMYIAYEDGQMVVLRNKRKGSLSMPKEWIL